MPRLWPLLVILALTGCRPDDAGISREQFVRVSVALRAVPDSAPDAMAQRRAILRRERVTAAQMERWVRSHVGSPVLGETWKEIVARIDSSEVRRRRPVRPPSEGHDPDEDSGAVRRPPPSPDELRRMREQFGKPEPPEDG